MTEKGKEQVLVAPDSVFQEYLVDGAHFYAADKNMLDSIRERSLFMERSKAENDTDYRQIIPYVIIRRMNGETRYYLFKRFSTQGESRLHNLRSLGAGGHINPVDTNAADPLREGLMRELNEELHLPAKYNLTFAGWIYSRIDQVASVHAGMVYYLDILEGDISVREKDKMTGEWCNQQELESYIDEMEGWSKIVMTCLID